MRCRWSILEELKWLQEQEYAKDDGDPICECGEPGWCCRCDEIARETGMWWDGTEYKSEEREGEG